MKCKSKIITGNSISIVTEMNLISLSGDSFVEYLKLSSKDSTLLKTDSEVEGRILKFQIDCGASVNIIPSHYIHDAKIMLWDTALEI